MLPQGPREEAWARLATDLPMELLDETIVEGTLADLPELAKKILAGQVRGRVVIDVNK
jgi:acrylyl-CoA reductase (NADPH)